RRFGVPFVTSYGFWYERLARHAGTRLLRRVVTTLGLRTASAVICTTPELAAHVARRAPQARVALIPNGVDTELFVPRARSDGATRTVIYVGRLSPEKNLGALVEAAGKLVGRWPLRLLVVGDATALAEALGCVLTGRDLARRLGAQARQDVRTRYDLSRLVAEEIALLQSVARR